MRQTFKDDFAKSAFSGIGENTIITGKYGVIQQIEDIYDIWFVGKDLNPLSGLRIGNLSRNPLLRGRLNVLNGEAYLQVSTPEEVRILAPLVGVRKKRKMTEKTLSQLQKMREDQSATISDKRLEDA